MNHRASFSFLFHLRWDMIAASKCRLLDESWWYAGHISDVHITERVNLPHFPSTEMPILILCWYFNIVYICAWLSLMVVSEFWCGPSSRRMSSLFLWEAPIGDLDGPRRTCKSDPLLLASPPCSFGERVFLWLPRLLSWAIVSDHQINRYP
jgi:hypothetical protein